MTSNRSSYLLLAGALVLVWLAMFLLGTGDLDLAILSALYAGHRPGFADAARLMTQLGGWYVVTPLSAIVALVLVLQHKAWAGLVLFVGTLAGRIMVDLQKYELGRLRPDENPHLVNVYNLSFPSGHSASAMMTYVAIPLFLLEAGRKRWWWIIAALALALCIGLSRILLGVHWPSDVIAGWSFGLLWAMLLAWLARNPPERAVRR